MKLFINPGECFGFQFNPSHLELLRDIPKSVSEKHSESQSNQLKVNPTQSDSFKFNPRL